MSHLLGGVTHSINLFEQRFANGIAEVTGTLDAVNLVEQGVAQVGMFGRI